MVSLAAINPLLSALDIKPTDRIISIIEKGNVDSNFIITHLIKQILQDNNNIVLVILHNTIGHYQNVGKRLGYDLLKHIDHGDVKTLEPLKEIANDIGDNPNSNYLIDDKEQLVRALFMNIKSQIESLASVTKRTYLVIDDVSHLLDLGVDVKFVVNFVNYCLSFVNTGNVSVIINTHVCLPSDEIIANNLNYAADVSVEVLPLKTGHSREVTGLIKIEKFGNAQPVQYHYKAYDKGVKTFHIGEALYNLYR